MKKQEVREPDFLTKKISKILQQHLSSLPKGRGEMFLV